MWLYFLELRSAVETENSDEVKRNQFIHFNNSSTEFCISRVSCQKGPICHA